MARKKEAKCCFQDNAIVTALFPHVQHDFLCVVALKYYTVNTERTQNFWMCKSNYHIINTKVAKLQDYNTTMWVLRPLKRFNTLPTHRFLAGHQPRPRLSQTSHCHPAPSRRRSRCTPRRCVWTGSWPRRSQPARAWLLAHAALVLFSAEFLEDTIHGLELNPFACYKLRKKST